MKPLTGAYYLKGEWLNTCANTWGGIFAAADRAGSKSVRLFLEGGIERLIKLGSDWVAI